MVKSNSNLELNTLEEVIKYMKDADALLIRNVEGEPKNWIENYSRMKRGKPERIEISEYLFMDCFDSPYFRPDSAAPKKKDELYFVYWELPEEK